MGRIILRERGIYALPDKREFVVRGGGRHGYAFYSHQAWNGSGSSEYRLNTEGRLLSKGTATRWRIGDITDTGRTAESPQVATSNALNAATNDDLSMAPNDYRLESD